MKPKTYYSTATVIFALVAFLHLLRALNGWEAVIGGIVVPIWVSWAAVVIAGYLALRGRQFMKKHK